VGMRRCSSCWRRWLAPRLLRSRRRWSSTSISSPAFSSSAGLGRVAGACRLALPKPLGLFLRMLPAIFWAGAGGILLKRWSSFEGANVRRSKAEMVVVRSRGELDAQPSCSVLQRNHARQECWGHFVLRAARAQNVGSLALDEHAAARLRRRLRTGRGACGARPQPRAWLAPVLGALAHFSSVFRSSPFIAPRTKRAQVNRCKQPRPRDTILVPDTPYRYEDPLRSGSIGPMIIEPASDASRG